MPPACDGQRYAGRSALVTGASSGIGAAFARGLAAEGADVLVTALEAERPALEALAAELAAAHDVRTAVLTGDLSTPDGAERLVEAADRIGFEPDVLVNSAGFGIGGRAAETDQRRQLAMIHLNAVALVALTTAYVARMEARGGGAVVNVGSTAAFQPMPYLAVYAATKAFVVAFGEAVWAESHPAGVKVVTLCPGPVQTAFHARAGDTERPTGIKRLVRRRYLTPEQVVAAALAAVDADRPLVVTRLAGGRIAYAAASALLAPLTRRRRLLALERLNRWLLLGR